MVCLGDLVGAFVLSLVYPKQHNTLIRNLLCCTKNAIKLVVHITFYSRHTSLTEMCWVFCTKRAFEKFEAVDCQYYTTSSYFSFK